MTETDPEQTQGSLVPEDEAIARIEPLLPDDRFLIEELIRLEEENPMADYGFIDRSPRPIGWDTDHANLPPSAYTKLLNAGLIQKFASTNSSKMYTNVVDAGTMQAVLDRADEVAEATTDATTDGSAAAEVVDRPGSFEELPDDLFDTVIGYDRAKRLFKRAITSEGQTHFALRGPPGVAKSAFLREIEALQGAAYRTANGMTRAGLTDFVINTKPTYLLLDELEKTKGGDADPANVLYNLMEEGIVQTTQSNRGSGAGDKTVQVPCDVYATVNDWQKLASPIQDRFVDLTFEPYDRETYVQVVVGVLQKFHDADSEYAERVALGVLDDLGERSVRTAEQVYDLSRSIDDVTTTIEDIATYR